MPYKDPTSPAARASASKANRAFYHRNKEKICADPKRKAMQKKAYILRWADPKYRAVITTQIKAYDAKHPEKGRKRSLDWRNRNLEKARAATREWSKTPAGRAYRRDYDHRRRTAKFVSTANRKSIKGYIALVRGKKSVRCYYCEKYFAGTVIHFDHIIPLSKGGAHAIENLCVACPKCNQTKLNKPIQEWLRLGQQILAL